MVDESPTAECVFYCSWYALIKGHSLTAAFVEDILLQILRFSLLPPEEIISQFLRALCEKMLHRIEESLLPWYKDGSSPVSILRRILRNALDVEYWEGLRKVLDVLVEKLPRMIIAVYDVRVCVNLDHQEKLFFEGLDSLLYALRHKNKQGLKVIFTSENPPNQNSPWAEVEQIVRNIKIKHIRYDQERKGMRQNLQVEDLAIRMYF
jgi:hypothetical protein